MVIYADVLVAVNYFVSYAMLAATARVAGVPLTRRRKVLGALAGGFAALAVFLPLQGFWFGLGLRAASAFLMLWMAWPRQRAKDYLRLAAILLGVSFLFAGGVVGLCFLWPGSPISCPGGMLYVRVSPLMLLLGVTGSYLLLGLVKRFYSQGRRTEGLCRVAISRDGQRVEVKLLRDTGNRLTEPFSGLPVAVCTLRCLLPLLRPEEREWAEAGLAPQDVPSGFRLVGYHAVGQSGLLPAFKPDGLRVLGREALDCQAWVAINPGPMPGCDGVFNPEMVELHI